MNRLKARHGTIAATLGFLWISLAPTASAQEIVLQCDAAHTTANFTLGDVLHTVHGSFKAKHGEFHFDSASGKASGEIVFDATSGDSGSAARDRKMHKEVIESQRYPEISFRPDHAEGQVVLAGTSTVQVHGNFGIHGTDHEITVPVEMKLAADHWEATAHFQVPYAQWGMKNPSILMLRVGNTVDIDLHAEGKFAAGAVR